MSCESINPQGMTCTIPGRHLVTHGYQDDEGSWSFWDDEVPQVSTRRIPTPVEMLATIADITQRVPSPFPSRVTLFDPEAAAVAREQAIADVDDHADERWKAAALDAIHRVAGRHHHFTADEVWEELEAISSEQTHEPAALGPLFLNASRRGWIKKTGQTVRTKIPRRHRDLTVWESLICQPMLTTP